MIVFCFPKSSEIIMINKVLCIDDDLITLKLYKMAFRQTQFVTTVDVVTNGKQALDYLETYAVSNSSNSGLFLPNLIFLDLNMPVMNGWGFLDTTQK